MESNHEKFERLRKLAEDLLQQNNVEHDSSGNEITELLHELRVHQVELNIQNEELRRVQEALEKSRQEYSDLFDYAPLAYFVIDEAGEILQANLTAVTKFGTTRQALHGTQLVYLVAREDRDKYYTYHQSILKSHHPQNVEVWFSCENIQPFYGRMESVVVNEDQDKKTVRVAITDITERKNYEERLESILELDQAILNGTTVEPLIEMVIDSLYEFAPFGYVAVTLFDNSENQAHSYVKDIRSSSEKITRQTDALSAFSTLLSRQNEDSYIIDNPVFLPDATRNSYPVHLVIPVKQGNHLQGVIDFGAQWSNEFEHMPLDFVRQVAIQLGIALHKLELAERVQEYTNKLEGMVQKRTAQLQESQESERKQRLFAEAMLSIVKQLNQTLDLQQVLELVLVSLERVIDYEGARIVILGDKNEDIMIVNRGTLQLDPEATGDSFSIEDYPIYLKMLRTRESVFTSDVDNALLVGDKSVDNNITTYLGIPIQAGKQLLGFMDVYSAQPDAFSLEDVVHVEAFADQASVAVKNARLYRKGQELAALEERQRLARDLHDAVSQLIFSLSAMAESLPNVIRKNQFERAEDISETMKLIASSAYAEMRLLLLELRPMSFRRVQLVELLQRLTTAFLGRYSSHTIDLDTEQIPSLSVEVKNGLYRIAQEAINNIGKHADAQSVKIRLWQEDNVVNLTINDDGKGFDTSQTFAGYGLRIVNERASNIGATVSVSSTFGEGTMVHVQYQAEE